MKILSLIISMSLTLCNLQAQDQVPDDFNTLVSLTDAIGAKSPLTSPTFTLSELERSLVSTPPPKVTIDGIYSQDKIEIIEDKLTTIIKHHLNGNTLTSNLSEIMTVDILIDFAAER